jgi:GNAT superfamily N-acetyltransferase
MRGQVVEELRIARGGALLGAERARRSGPAVVVGTLDGVVVGYGAARVRRVAPGQVIGVIDEVYVEPAARGVGVGEAILDGVTKWCIDAGCTALDATALPGDRHAKGFFERHGFTARLLIMHRPLSPPTDG